MSEPKTAEVKVAGPLWMMHVLGPDDIYAAPDHATAVQWCADLNRQFDGGDVLLVGVPAIWTGTSEAHAEQLPLAVGLWGDAAPPAPSGWRTMESAPRDRAPVRALIHADLYPRVKPGRDDLVRWNGQEIVVHHPGIADDGFDTGWSLSAPVGHGGFPDEWFVGWLPTGLSASPPAETGEGEPVAWRYRFVTTTDGLEWSDWNYADTFADIVGHKGQSVEPLYTHPASDQSDTERMRAALEPFAEIARRYPTGGLHSDLQSRAQSLISLMRAKDFYAARAALAEKAADQ